MLPQAPSKPSGERPRGSPSGARRLVRPPTPPPTIPEDGPAPPEFDLDAPPTEVMENELTFAECVGKGVTAEVFRGEWKGKEVCIKQILLGKKITSHKHQVAFSREVSVLSKLKHPHLLELFGVCFGNKLCVITEFCSGGSLFELLHNCYEIELQWSQKTKMATDVASAMHYLHTFKPQIIHRDLKSLNLLLAKPVLDSKTTPIVKVADLGLARMKDMDAEWEKMTKSVGTCHWMAPEVISGRYDVKADVYSYAMCLFEIICRQVPFEDEEGADVINLIGSGKRPELQEAVPPGCPKGLTELMVKCWDQEPDARPEFSSILAVVSKM
ncbi:unnamed protein product [Polarella glacialis]|uniref:Protein kinase domain-containing protein n=1 Tax=Polarella glacialis TaxID=89957 RepID=A0A813GJ74_POLGL|nr:unnamed protein product [Polarella glacialis]